MIERPPKGARQVAVSTKSLRDVVVRLKAAGITSIQDARYLIRSRIEQNAKESKWTDAETLKVMETWAKVISDVYA